MWKHVELSSQRFCMSEMKELSYSRTAKAFYSFFSFSVGRAYDSKLILSVEFRSMLLTGLGTRSLRRFWSRKVKIGSSLYTVRYPQLPYGFTKMSDNLGYMTIDKEIKRELRSVTGSMCLLVKGLRNPRSNGMACRNGGVWRNVMRKLQRFGSSYDVTRQAKRERGRSWSKAAFLA